jgi:integrase
MKPAMSLLATWMLMASTSWPHAELRVALADVLRRGLVPTNVAALAEVKTPRPRPVAEMPQEKAWALLEAGAEDRLSVLYLVTLRFGLRPAEVLGLRWSDIGQEANLLTSRSTLH